MLDPIQELILLAGKAPGVSKGAERGATGGQGEMALLFHGARIRNADYSPCLKSSAVRFNG